MHPTTVAKWRCRFAALSRTAPTLPVLPTTPRATHDYERNGTCDLFAALEIATGKVITVPALQIAGGRARQAQQSFPPACRHHDSPLGVPDGD